MASPDLGESRSTGGVANVVEDLIQFNLNVKDDGSDDELIDLGEGFRKSPPGDTTDASGSFHTDPDERNIPEGGDPLDCTAELRVPPDGAEGTAGSLVQLEPEVLPAQPEVVPVQQESPVSGAQDGNVTAAASLPPEGAVDSPPEGTKSSPPEGAVGTEKPLTVEMLKEKELMEAETFTIAQQQEAPPSYEEAMGLVVTNQNGATGSSANQRPAEKSSANEKTKPSSATTKRQAGDTAANQSSVAVASPDGGNLYYLDFIPNFHYKHNNVDVERTETFNVLVDRASTWLKSNPNYSVVNCETVVQYWARSHGHNPYRVIATRSKVSGDVTVCMHVLRVWFKVDDHQVAPQVLHFQDFWTPYEKRLQDLVDMINSPTYKLQGRILRIETVPHNRGGSSGLYFDERTSHTCCCESSSENKNYTFFIRVFTIQAQGQGKVKRGLIGFMDFVPEKRLDIHPMNPLYGFPHERYETFPALVRNLHWWLNNKLGGTSRLVTVQSLPVKVKTGAANFWQRVNYTEKSGLYSGPSEYLVILRAFYEQYSAKSEPVVEPRDITYRSFAPLQLTDGPVLEFETFVKMTERVALWVKLTGAKVRSVETIKIPMYPAKVQDNFSDVDPLTYTAWHILPRHYADHSHWIYAIRLYLEEPVEEPPVNLMPAAPNVAPYYLRPPPSSVAIQPGAWN